MASHTTRSAPSPGETTLYRFYDASDDLLYVGITDAPVRRFEQHRRKRVWWGRVATIQIKRFSTRGEALIAEALAIDNEEPMFNIQRPTPAHAGLDGARVAVRPCVHCGFSSVDEVHPNDDSWDSTNGEHQQCSEAIVNAYNTGRRHEREFDGLVP